MSNEIKTTETKVMADVVRDIIEQRLVDIRVSTPGKIIKYNRSKRKAEIQPLLKKKYKGKEPLLLSPIPDVPVIMPTGCNGKATIDIPLKKGDTGDIIFSDRSLDLWLVQGGEVAPEDPRKFDITDAKFYPGLCPFNASHDTKNLGDDKLGVMNGEIKMILHPNGKIEIKGPTAEMVDAISTWMGHVLNGKILTLMGAQGWIAATLALLQIDKLKFDTLKS